MSIPDDRPLIPFAASNRAPIEIDDLMLFFDGQAIAPGGDDSINGERVFRDVIQRDSHSTPIFGIYNTIIQHPLYQSNIISTRHLRCGEFRVD